MNTAASGLQHQYPRDPIIRVRIHPSVRPYVHPSVRELKKGMPTCNIHINIYQAQQKKGGKKWHSKSKRKRRARNVHCKLLFFARG